ncbi:MAG: hypothetical protein ABWY58_06655, partial [Aeromicrobium sp.]
MTTSPLARGYLDDLRSVATVRLGPLRADELVADIDEHLKAGVAGGQPVEDVIARLGSPAEIVAAEAPVPAPLPAGAPPSRGGAPAGRGPGVRGGGGGGVGRGGVGGVGPPGAA